jgi:hypothetical protein
MNKFRSLSLAGKTPAMLLAIALVVACGCGRQQTIKLDSSETKAFDDAPADVKQAWQNALAADAANDYMNTQKLLDGLKQMSLNDDQKKALSAETDAFHFRLTQAAEKNDPAATKAVVAINQELGNGR